MKVLHVLNSLGAGGAEQYVVRLANDLTSHGVCSAVVAGLPHSLAPRLPSGAQVILQPPSVGGAGTLLTWALRCALSLPRINQILREVRPDLIHTHLVGSGFAFWIAGRFRGIPTVHTAMHVSSIASKSERMLYRSGLAGTMATRFLALSNYFRKEMISDWRLPASKVVVVRSGVDTSVYQPNLCARDAVRAQWGIPSNALVVGMASRLSPEKGVDLAIRAIAITRAAECPVHLVVAGEGPQRPALESLIRQLNIGNRVRLLGHVRDTSQVIPCFDLYLQTGNGPNLGFASLEALASGVPLLMAARSDIEREMVADTLVDGSCGWAVDAVPEAIGRHLQMLAEQRDHVISVGYAARSIAVRYYDWQAHLAGIMRLYTDLAGCNNSVASGDGTRPLSPKQVFKPTT